MKYILRIYYDLFSGEIIFYYTQSGETVKVMPMSHDYAVYPQLAGRTEADTGCLEWQERDEEIETKLVGGEYVVSVDVTQTPHTLIFTLTPEDPDPELTDAELIAVLTGEAE